MSSWFVRWARQLLHAHILVPGRNDLCTRPMPYASQRRRARATFLQLNNRSPCRGAARVSCSTRARVCRQSAHSLCT